MKYWYEVDKVSVKTNISNTGNAKKENVKWVPHNKGGMYQKWYGNNDYIVFFENDGEAIKHSGVLNGYEYYFNPGITWTALTTGSNSFRYSFGGFLFDSNKGPMVFHKNKDIAYYFLSYFNSPVAQSFMKLLNPTLSLQNGDMNKLPIIFPKQDSVKQKIYELTQQNINTSKEEWDSRETSWDFTASPLVNNEKLKVKNEKKLEDIYDAYCDYWREKFFTLHVNEEELNRLFIEIYELGEELTPDVELKDM